MKRSPLQRRAPDLWIGVEPYDDDAKRWLGSTDHYLSNPPPGCLFCVVVRTASPGLFDDTPLPAGPRLGMCLVGRPVARALPQDGSVGEVTRLWLAPGLPYGLASRVLRAAAETTRAKGMAALISYHDRTRHTGCIYRKAGFKKDGRTYPTKHGWASRGGRVSGAQQGEPKQRWRLAL